MPDAVANAEPSTGRARVFAAMAVSGSVLACLLFAEIVLRFLPVATGMWAMPVNASNPIFRFTPDREFLFSRDWNFSLVNRGHINNDGFVNDENYAENDSRPLLAVVGDSYVEAAMVPNDKTFYRRQSAKLGGKGRIYSFGASGAPLSQYLVWAQYAAQKYRAGAIAIIVVGNDFDESLWAYNKRPGLHVYVKGPNGRLQLRRTDYRPSPLRSLVRHSALGRYLVFHLHVLETTKEIAARWGFTAAHAETPQYVGNTAAEASPERVRDSQEAIAAFLDDLGKMVALPPDRIALLVDGARYESNIEVTERSYFGQMRGYFMRQASQRGYEVIDLQPLFVARSRDGSRFEFPTDAHWNAIAHEVAAEALGASRLYRMMFAPP
ncbi:MAG: hypothetical protein ACJ8FP_13135 [Xanthobacteraceae bacterium]